MLKEVLRAPVFRKTRAPRYKWSKSGHDRDERIAKDAHVWVEKERLSVLDVTETELRVFGRRNPASLAHTRATKMREQPKRRTPKFDHANATSPRETQLIGVLYSTNSILLLSLAVHQRSGTAASLGREKH